MRFFGGNWIKYTQGKESREDKDKDKEHLRVLNKSRANMFDNMIVRDAAVE